MKIHNIFKTIAAAALGLSLLTACSGNNGSSAASSGENGLKTLRVANMTGQPDQYADFIGQQQGIFEKHGIDLQTTFEATRGGFAGGPLYDNKIPKLIHRDYEPGARVAVHRKDILNAKHYAHHLGVDTPMTDVVLQVMDWMNDNGHIDEDQIAMVKYYEDKMGVTVGSAD